MKKSLIIVLIVVVLAVIALLAVFVLPRAFSGTGQTETAESSAEPADQNASDSSQTEEAGHLETISYTISYEGVSYDKVAYVYVPASYDSAEPMNILYLMHGSQGSGEQLAESMEPLFDRWISEGNMQPMLVVFPTYYPDDSFVVSDYSRDYTLNHFFAENEIHELMKTAESSFHTYAESTDDAGLSQSRMHRAFGGYSMGGVTTWDVLASQADYFAYYMPMAGDCWLDRVSDEPVDDLLMQGLEDGGYSSGDFLIIAMVGGNDGTKYSMKPQIEALREEHSDLITDENLIYWENEGGGHSQESFEKEVEHGLPYLWTLQ